MEYGENLTLKEAASFAGVSEGTMRSWVKDISDIERYPGGGYGIPRDALTAYLGAKQWRKAGATRGRNHGAHEADSGHQFLEGLKGELSLARDRVRELEQRNRDLVNELVSITREMRELVFGNGKPGLSAWMPKIQPKMESSSVQKSAPVAKKVQPAKAVAPAPKKASKKKSQKSKSPVKKKTKGRR